MPHFTPIEQRILNVLADRRPHTEVELLACLEDSEASRESLFKHISLIRKKLLPNEQYIHLLPRQNGHLPCYVFLTGYSYGMTQ